MEDGEEGDWEGLEDYEEDEVKTRPLGCNTHKGTGADDKRVRTAGALYMASPCGIVLAMIELYGSESLSQVFNGGLGGCSSGVDISRAARAGVSRGC